MATVSRQMLEIQTSLSEMDLPVFPFSLIILKDYDQIIRQFQIIQKVREAIVIEIAARYSKAAMAQIVAELRPFIGKTNGGER